MLDDPLWRQVRFGMRVCLQAAAPPHARQADHLDLQPLQFSRPAQNGVSSEGQTKQPKAVQAPKATAPFPEEPIDEGSDMEGIDDAGMDDEDDGSQPAGMHSSSCNSGVCMTVSDLACDAGCGNMHTEQG